MLLAGTAFGADAVGDAPLAPAAPIVEKPFNPASNDLPGDQPTPQHVWIPGHWRWLEGAYVWEAGRWEVPPTPTVAWNPPQWRPQGSGYILSEGFWDEVPPAPPANQEALAPTEIVVTEPPPAPRREFITERPMGTHVWIPGYWLWRDGRYAWVGGQWTAAPRPNAMWVQPRWELRGRGYVFTPGYWRDQYVATPPPAVPQFEPPQPVATQPAPQPQVVYRPQAPQPQQPQPQQQVVYAPQPPQQQPQQQVVYAPQPPQQVIVAAPPPPQQVIVMVAPPQPRREVVYARPSPYHVWVPGYWAWHDRRHVWIAGHYQLPPRGYREWHNPRWERRGGSHVFIEGRWGR